MQRTSLTRKRHSDHPTVFTVNGWKERQPIQCPQTLHQWPHQVSQKVFQERWRCDVSRRFQWRPGQRKSRHFQSVQRFELVDAIHYYHGQARDRFTTWIDGCEILDYILVLRALLPFINSCGCEPFMANVPGDHRSMFVDFDTIALYGTEISALAVNAPRRITSTNPNHVRDLHWSSTRISWRTQLLHTESHIFNNIQMTHWQNHWTAREHVLACMQSPRSHNTQMFHTHQQLWKHAITLDCCDCCCINIKTT